jgi:hypothetical protein
MQIKEILDVSFPGSVESSLPKDAVVLADGVGVALGVQRAFSARVRSVRDEGPLECQIVVADNGLGITEKVSRMRSPLASRLGRLQRHGRRTRPSPALRRRAGRRHRYREQAGCRHANAPLSPAGRRCGSPKQPRRCGDHVHGVTQRRRIPCRQPSDGRADLLAGANAWRPVQQ